MAIDLHARASKKNLFARKIYESPLFQLERTDTGPGISFPGRSCPTFLVTFVLNRRHDPDILSASSLTCRYRYIGSAPATIGGETKSLFFILDRARANRVYIFSRRGDLSRLKTHASFPKRTLHWETVSVSLGEKRFSIISEKLLSSLSVILLHEDKWIKISWRIFIMYTRLIIQSV